MPTLPTADADAATRIAARLEESLRQNARLERALADAHASADATASALSAEVSSAEAALGKAEASLQALWTSRRALVDEIVMLRARVDVLERRETAHSSSGGGGCSSSSCFPVEQWRPQPVAHVISTHLTLAAAAAEDRLHEAAASSTCSLVGHRSENKSPQASREPRDATTPIASPRAALPRSSPPGSCCMTPAGAASASPGLGLLTPSQLPQPLAARSPACRAELETLLDSECAPAALDLSRVP